MNDTNGMLPPAAIADPKNGKPLLSWRVAILPYIEQDTLYKRFKLNEPWDSAHNKALLDLMPKTFELPESGAAKDHTWYQLITGPNTAFNDAVMPLGGPFGRQGPKLPGSFTDGTSNTLLIVESNKAVPWTKPEDVVYDAKKPLPNFGGPFTENTWLGAMVDGSVLRIGKRVSEATLRAAITPAGGEILGRDWPNGPDDRK
jgi:hypothetical protein